MNRKFPFALLLPSSARVCDGQIIVRGRILWLELHSALERGNCLRKVSRRDQCQPPPEKGISEPRVQLDCAREMLHRVVPLLPLTSELAQNVFRTGIAGINLQFL